MNHGNNDLLDAAYGGRVNRLRALCAVRTRQVRTARAGWAKGCALALVVVVSIAVWVVAQGGAA